MASGQPFQRNFNACLISSTCGMFELHKIIFGMGKSSIVFGRKADLTIRLKIKDGV